MAVDEAGRVIGGALAEDVLVRAVPKALDAVPAEVRDAAITVGC